MTTSPVLRRVLRGQLCSGCGACAAIAPQAISMEIEEPGYLRPVQRADLTAEQEVQIAEVCPGTGYTQDPKEREDHPLWGPIVKLRTGYAVDPKLRKNGSSGGALSAVLMHLLETQAVDAVLQTAADPELPIGNKSILSISSPEIFAAAGSRYAPSAPLAGLDRHLASGTRFAFVGKPCDVAALRAMERFDPRIAKQIPVMISFFCAGVPSLNGARRILAHLGVVENDIEVFRYRGDGWPGSARATMRDGTTRQMSYAESWGGILSKHLQFRCKICPDGTGGFADIVCADAWETDANGYPLFEEREGVSLILSRTQKGEAFVRACVATGKIAAEAKTPDSIQSMQPGQTRKRQATLPRLMALGLTLEPIPKYRGFYLLRNALAGGFNFALRNFIGTIFRVVRGNRSISSYSMPLY